MYGGVNGGGGGVCVCAARVRAVTCFLFVIVGCRLALSRQEANLSKVNKLL